MSKKNNWLRSLSVILAVALILTAVGSYFPPGQYNAPFVSGSINATPDHPLTELAESDYRLDHSSPSQYMKFEPDVEDGKVSVIIGFTGEPARGAHRQATLAQQKTLVESFGGDVGRGFTIINSVSARLPLQAVEALSKRHEVSYLEPDYKVSLISQQTPWGIDRIFGPEKYSFLSWDHSRGQGIVVAVLDTGIDENHIDLPNLLGGVNTVDSTHWGSDGHGHGTHVAGIIAAVDNNTGVVGAAPDTGLYAVKVLDDKGWGTYSSVIAGIDWAFNKNIPVMNMSLGGSVYSEALEDAVNAAYAGGTLLVAAAGNDGDSTDNVLYPARYSSVIAVSASDSNNKLASFSSRGPSIELIAPGVSILSLYPGNYMVRSSGTSMASPHVAGSAAVLWGANPDLSNIEIRNILRQTAEDLGLNSNHQGYGLVRADLAVGQALPALSSNADLSGLIFSVGTQKPAFESGITDYTIVVAHDINSIDVTPNLSATGASITINGAPAACSESKKIILENAGTATEIVIIVNAEDGVTQKNYIIIVNRLDFGQTFTDVPLDHPFFVEIEKLVALGITIGWPDGTFRPTLPVTRQAIAAFLFRAFDLGENGEPPAEPTFADVPVDHPFFEEIEALAASGIAEGWPDGTFRPTLAVTRQAVATFLFRALELEDFVVTEPNFSDVSLDHPFIKEIEALATTGITTGWPDGTFRPTLNVTRQAMAAFLVRALELDDQ